MPAYYPNFKTRIRMYEFFHKKDKQLSILQGGFQTKIGNTK